MKADSSKVADAEFTIFWTLKASVFVEWKFVLQCLSIEVLRNVMKSSMNFIVFCDVLGNFLLSYISVYVEWYAIVGEC